jgi:hypothetical protein
MGREGLLPAAGSMPAFLAIPVGLDLVVHGKKKTETRMRSMEPQ